MKKQEMSKKKKCAICGRLAKDILRISQNCLHEHCSYCDSNKKSEWPCLQCEYPQNFVEGEKMQYKKCYHCMNSIHSELIRIALPPSCDSGHQWCYYCFTYRQYSASGLIDSCSSCERKNEGGKGAKQANNALYYQKHSEEIKRRSREYKQKNRDHYNEKEKLRKRKERQEERLFELQRLKRRQLHGSDKTRYIQLRGVEERYNRKLESEERQSVSNLIKNLAESM